MRKKIENFAGSEISRKTQKLFDRSIKFIIAEASRPAVVHLINGLYNKSYPPDTTVEVKTPREYITKNPKSGALGGIYTDMVVILSGEGFKDTYLIEAQIKDDMEMSLRVFEYSIQIALENKVVSEGGTYLRISMPEPVVIYWETSRTKDFLTIEMRFPGDKSVVYNVPAFKVLKHSVSELEHLALLLPFYLLKVRAELKRAKNNSSKRKELAKRLVGYVDEICKALQKSQENNYITDVDVAMLKERMSNIHMELYGDYKEFTEVDMTLKQMYNTSIFKKVEDAEARGVAIGEVKGILRTARQMKAEGLGIDVISRVTGLSEAEIERLDY